MTYDTPGQRQLPVGENPMALMETLVRQALTQSHPCSLAPKAGRPFRLSEHLLAAGLLWCVLHGWVSQWDLWRRVSVFGVGELAPVKVCDQAVYNRLGKRGSQLMQTLCGQVSMWLWHWLAPYEERDLAPFAKQVLALDESTMPSMNRWISDLQAIPSGSHALLAGRLVALFDIRRQQWVRLDWLPKAIANCQVHAEAMLSEVQMGTLLLFDLGYYNFRWFETLTQRGIWWVARLRAKGSYRIEHYLVQRDGYVEALVWLGAYRADQSAYLVRLVRLRYRGQWYEYLSNVTDPLRLSGAQIVGLYARRWDIELGWRLLKDHLRLNLLTSAKAEVIGAQLWATVILAQVLHALQVQVAAESGVDTFDVSLELLWRYLPALAERARRQGKTLLEIIEQDGRALKLLRPGTRIHRAVPDIPWQEMSELRSDLTWIRPPRHSSRRNTDPKRRSKKVKAEPGII